MRKIVSATADIDSPENILIELDTGVTVNLTLEPKLNNPLFAEIKELSMPRTDGERVYWHNGASLTMDEIMKMLRADCKPPAEKLAAFQEPGGITR